MGTLHIGQRVEYRMRGDLVGARIDEEDRARNGKRGVIVKFGPIYPPSRFTRWQVRFDDGDYCDPIEDCLHPIDDAADYQRFMERVMKPVDLGQPVSA